MINSTPAQPRGEKKNMKGLKSLNLSDEQETKLKGLRDAHQKIMIDSRAEMQKAMIDKRELIEKGTIDRKKFLDAENKLLTIRNKISVAQANHKMDVYAELTAEQQTRISKMPLFFSDGSGRNKGKFGNCQGDCQRMRNGRQAGFHGGRK